MRVYYIGNLYDGCYYVRCYLPMINNGWHGERETMLGTRKPLEVVAKEVLDYDVVVFQRPDEEVRVKVASMLKQLGKKVVFDNDDTYKNIEDIMKFKHELKKRNNAIDKFIKLADLVTTTTEYLADEYRQLSDRVIVLPNCVDEFDWGEPLQNEGDKVRIGIVGSAATVGDQVEIEQVLKYLNSRNDVQMVMFGLPVRHERTKKVQELYKNEYKFWKQFNVEWQPFVPMSDYPDTLNELKLDLMLIPRKDNYFNHCKSNIKFLEASMLEIPVIAQGFKDGLSPYQADITDDIGRIAITHDDWIKHIDELVADKNKRRLIGQKAKEYTLKNYNIKDKAHLWYGAYKTLYDNR